MQAMYTKYYFFEALENPYQATDLHIRSNILQMGLAIKYEYPTGKWRPTLAVGGAAIGLPDGQIEKITDRYVDDEVHPYYVINDFPKRFMFGFEIIPGVHYYLTSKRIIFLQAQFLQCKGQQIPQYSPKMIRSFGLSAGIYF